MIEQSFVFLERIGFRKERGIWQQGIRTWQDFLLCENIRGVSGKRKGHYNRKIQEAQQALWRGDYSYFIGKLPQKEMWRLYPFVKEECCFVDIEIDGNGRIVVVGVSNYFQTNFFVRGVNLQKEMVERELGKYKAIITFNGGAFDVPKLWKELGVDVGMIHIDLKPLCVNMEMKGGLKEVERQLQLRRPFHLYGNPIDLWKAFHASGDREYLELLLDYNREDCENLKNIMEFVYKGMVKNYIN